MQRSPDSVLDAGLFPLRRERVALARRRVVERFSGDQLPQDPVGVFVGLVSVVISVELPGDAAVTSRLLRRRVAVDGVVVLGVDVLRQDRLVEVVDGRPSTVNRRIDAEDVRRSPRRETLPFNIAHSSDVVLHGLGLPERQVEDEDEEADGQ